MAYRVAIEAPAHVSGILNVATCNHTIGEIAEFVRSRLHECAGIEVDLQLHHRRDCRNYRVSTEKAQRILGFRPAQEIPAIVDHLFEHRVKFADTSNEAYYNIRRLRTLKAAGDKDFENA